MDSFLYLKSFIRIAPGNTIKYHKRISPIDGDNEFKNDLQSRETIALFRFFPNTHAVFDVI
jgi:hypothetical protein